MVWTNAVGAVFTATLLSVGDGGATFRFAEDGAVETLPLAKLSPASAKRACDEAGYVPVPPALAAVFAQARRDLARIDGLVADGRLSAEEGARRRAGVRAALAAAARERGLEEGEVARIVSEAGFARP